MAVVQRTCQRRAKDAKYHLKVFSQLSNFKGKSDINMQAIGPVYGLCVLIHFALFVTSLQPARTVKLLQALSVLVLALPVYWVERRLEASGASLYGDIAGLLEKARYILPFLSFVVYLNRKRRPGKTSR